MATMLQQRRRAAANTTHLADDISPSSDKATRIRRWLLMGALAAVAAHLLVVAASSDLSWPGRAVMALVLMAGMGLTVWLTTSQRRGRRGVGMVLGGLAGVVAGGAVGLMALVATGPSPAAILGVLALLAGLGLLGTGAVEATRALHRWWRPLMLPIALVVLQFVVLTLPFALYATHVPIEPFDDPVPPGATPSVVTTGDGVALTAWYTPSRNGAAVVLRHGSGSGSSKASTAAHAQVLAAHGYGVLAMDARGHGESAGQAMDLGWYGDEDVAAGVAWLAARPEVDPDRIGGVGMSMGGEELVGALAAVPELRAVVAEGVTGRTGADHEALGYDGVEAVIDRLTSAITFGTTDLLTRASQPTPLADAVAGLDGRAVLLIAGTPVEEAQVARLLEASTTSGETQVWAVPDAGHIAALRVHPEEWAQHVIAFLDRTLSS